MKTLIDYGHLGLDPEQLVLTPTQRRPLDEASQQIAELARTAADRARRRECEVLLRQWTLLEQARLNVTVDVTVVPSAGRWFGARIVRQNLDSVPISETSFENATEKSIIAELRVQLANIIEESQHQLTIVQLVALRRAVDLFIECCAREEYIAAIEIQQALTESQPGWDQQFERRDRAFVPSCIVPLALLLVGPAVAYFIGHVLDMLVPAINGTVVSWAGSVIAIIAAVVLFRKFSSSSAAANEEISRLTRERDTLIKDLPVQARMTELRQRFGTNVTLAQLKSEQERCQGELAMLLDQV